MVRLQNIHPGEVLLDEFLIPMGISQKPARTRDRCGSTPHQ